ncbi:hypothetical protein DPMN_167012 [Dreissena polymorpha]|uniref:Uncharacterized protein n=1 Tax=Dreissena polymorpha TaxID=45954 RepID=A0A9D4F345_DREPO|nr:hypothetical protein DPMN_167012 [Dreissena polymorpha]
MKNYKPRTVVALLCGRPTLVGRQLTTRRVQGASCRDCGRPTVWSVDCGREKASRGTNDGRGGSCDYSPPVIVGIVEVVVPVVHAYKWRGLTGFRAREASVGLACGTR